MNPSAKQDFTVFSASSRKEKKHQVSMMHDAANMQENLTPVEKEELTALKKKLYAKHPSVAQADKKAVQLYYEDSLNHETFASSSSAPYRSNEPLPYGFDSKTFFRTVGGALFMIILLLIILILFL